MSNSVALRGHGIEAKAILSSKKDHQKAQKSEKERKNAKEDLLLLKADKFVYHRFK